MHIYLGADHRGIELKKLVINWLSSHMYTFTDFGPSVFDAEDDYNDYAKKVAHAIQDQLDGEAFGILICGSAQGMAMQANRFKGIRAAICHNTQEAIETRGHNDANILCLSADATDDRYNEIIDAFLDSAALPDEKYKRRTQKLDEN